MSEEIFDLTKSENNSEEPQYTVEEVAQMAAISVTLVRRLTALNVIEADRERLRAKEIARLTQILRLRRDLGVNWVGAGMLLDLSQEIACLKARLRAYESHQSGSN